MDDSIFVELVNALINSEKEDKEREQIKKGKESLRDQRENEKKDGDVKSEVKVEKTESGMANPFPSIHIFNVRRLKMTPFSIFILSYISILYFYNYYFRQSQVCSLTKEGPRNLKKSILNWQKDLIRMFYLPNVRLI